MADSATNSDLATRTHAMWIAGAQAADTHGAFRARFHLDAAVELVIAATGASWFAIYVDGAFLLDGPTRPHPGAQEWSEQRVQLAAGGGALAAGVRPPRLPGRLAPPGPPLFFGRAGRTGALLGLGLLCCAF